jgi:hypothetical protein
MTLKELSIIEWLSFFGYNHNKLNKLN